ncbi:sensor histidine kinase [Vandammella animalimorsus]|uniref:ATP-binding protein n=1 Tax=Vandammella animalimorsus TaxID=2029117 RepID=UPI0031BA72CA
MRTKATQKNLHFDVSTGLKRVLGRELITDDEVAIFELVKNSFDAGADTVHLHFSEDRIVVADNGSGMTYDDLTQKWLFVAYSSKRTERPEGDFRNIAAERRHFAGSKGIGRFSSDRLGKQVVVQSRAKDKDHTVHQLTVDWERFEKNDREHFDSVPVAYAATGAFDLPPELAKFAADLKHGTVIDVRKLRRPWDRTRILALKGSLAKLINPFGDQTDRFSIQITAPKEQEEDKRLAQIADKANQEALPKDIVNGRVGNFIFAALQDKTTFIRVSIDGDWLNTTLTDRSELIYRIREPNPYANLKDSGFVCEIYYLNQSAKATFTRRIGLQPVQFGSVFLFRNNFRVYPIGEDGNDWFGFDRRKQQGYARFLGTREIIGRVDVFGSDEDFQEASSRNQGLIDTVAVQQLRRAVMENCLKRLEKYVVPVSWVDKADANTDDLSRLLTDPGRARVSAAVASLVDNDQIELLEYSRNLIDLINERSEKFEESLVSLRAIAEKTGDKSLLTKLDAAERRFDELKRSEAEARKVADQERRASAAAMQLAKTTKAEAEVERRRAHFLESIVDIDAATILNLHHQITIYAVDIAQQIENLLAESAGKTSIPRDAMLKAVEQMAFLNRKILAVTRFASRAKFKLDSETIETDLPEFLTDYIEQIARTSGSARLQIDVVNGHPGMKMRFKPIDVSIIIDNLVSNAKRARATRIKFELAPIEKRGLLIRATDNGRGFASGTNKTRIFEMGYTTTQGSGLGLYHVHQVLGEIGGSIELEDSEDKNGTTFIIKITPLGKNL